MRLLRIPSEAGDEEVEGDAEDGGDEWRWAIWRGGIFVSE